MALMLTRIEVEDYDAWKSMFDEDQSRVRRDAKGYRIARGVENPNELFIQVEFPGRTGPTIVDVAEKVSY
jgi:hypothetical protein